MPRDADAVRFRNRVEPTSVRRSLEQGQSVVESLPEGVEVLTC
jgi:hypothetical protein